MRHHRFIPHTILALIVLLATAACSTSPVPAATPATSATVVVADVATALPATAVPAPTTEPAATATATAEPTATATSLPSPTPTPLPAVTLAVPSVWEAAAQEAVDALASGENRAYAWTVTTTDDPVAALAAGTAQIALQPGNAGEMVRDEPLALAVPFTTNWAWVNGLEAETILTEGHRLAQPIPWSAMTPDLKALRVDGLHPYDAGYPHRDTWSLVAEPGADAAVAELAPFLADAMAPPPAIHLAAVGDIMLDRALGQAITQGSVDYPFAEVASVLQTADYTIGNFESSLGDVGEPAEKRYRFQSPPIAAESVARAGIDLVSLANNHALDFGPEALLQGISLFQDQGVAVVGAGVDDPAAHAPYITAIGEFTVAFLGYVHVPIESLTNFDTASWTATVDTPGLAWADPERIRADVAGIRDDVDLVVVQLHSGYEYIEEPSQPQVAASYAAIEAGADLVIGHHAHILQGVQRYLDGVIVYGLGNFAFNIEGPPETAVLNVWLDGNGVRQVEILPAFVQEWGQPRMAEAWETAPILERVNFLTTILNAQPPSPDPRP